ncbi:MAG: PLP-dependent aminotransferase family protein [Eggerthellaceae bacterium]
MLTYSLEQRNEEPLYSYLYHRIRNDIESGTLAANTKLPSKRTFAEHQGVSLITIEGAYAQLIAEGYIRAEQRKGYYVNAIASHQNRPSTPTPIIENPSQNVLPGTNREPRRSTHETASFDDTDYSMRSAPLIDLSSGVPAPQTFPYRAWARSLKGALAEESEDSLLRQSGVAGSWQLRCVIADYLRSYRAMDVDPSQIVIGAGTQVLYHFIIQLLGRQAIYALEDPGYPRLARIYRANNVATAPIALDSEGIDVDQLSESGANIAHVMPSHQFPSGIVTSIARRYRLLEWANTLPERYIIEDDYDCEFRLSGKPIPALASLDATQKVIYANTFAKTLGPAFRIAYMVLPRTLTQRFHAELGFYSSTVGAIDQLALARFIENGDYERHINRTKTQYRTLKNTLIAALKRSALGNEVRIEEEDAGLHFILHIESLSAPSEQEFSRQMESQGVRLVRIADFCLDTSHAQRTRGFLVNYSGIAEEQIPALIHALERAFTSAINAS